mgnify:CR=1
MDWKIVEYKDRKTETIVKLKRFAVRMLSLGVLDIYPKATVRWPSGTETPNAVITSLENDYFTIDGRHINPIKDTRIIVTG